MRKATVQSIQQIFVGLIVLLLSLTAVLQPPASSLSLPPITTNTQNPKITGVLNLIDENLVFEYLKTLVGFGPRMTGTYGCEQAAQYIHTQFMEMGLSTRYQNWTAWGNYRYPHVYSSQNIEATLPGAGNDTSVIIFNAHYDTVAASPGANDDGSGTAAVLAAAYALSHFDFQRTVRFVTFSGEEISLLGSRAYAKEAYEQNDRILVEINADMIGRDEGSRKMRVTASEDVIWVSDIFKMISETYPIGLNVTQGTINRVGHTLRGSDYASFLLYGWECIACWQVDRDQNFHTPRDDLSNVNISYLVNTTRLIAATLAYLADVPETPPQVRIVSPRIGYFYHDGLEKRQISQYKTTVLNDIWIWAEVDFASAPIVRADFYYDGVLMHIDTEEPFSWHFNRRSFFGKHEITVVVYDALGRSSMDWREIRFINLRIRR